jgi:SAM-dependent methyltransferase
MNQTLTYYNENAKTLAPRYESADVAKLWRDLTTTYPAGSRLLELGCGSGRDAAYLTRQGYKVTAVDGSAAMLEAARASHPELGDSLLQLALPALLPFADGSFDGVMLIAVLMHLDRDAIAQVLAEACRVLKSDGRLFVSVPLVRDDVAPSERDGKGRLFVSESAENWVSYFNRTGFSVVRSSQSGDGLGRSGILWGTFVGQKPTAADRSR